MAFRIVWSKAASDDVQRIVKYIRKEWSDASAEKFVDRLLHKVEILIEYPQLGLLSQKSQRFRKLKIDQHNFVVYEIDDGKILIHSVLAFKMDHSSDPRF